MSVVVIQPADEFRQHTGIVKGHNLFSHLELPPKHFLIFELVKELGSRRILLLSGLAGDAQANQGQSKQLSNRNPDAVTPGVWESPLTDHVSPP
jgi:hypothetical protein